MGSNKFGPPGRQDDPQRKGWWGENPPFHTPAFVLTHRPRTSIEMAGGKTLGVEGDYAVEAVSAPSGVTHLTFTR